MHRFSKHTLILLLIGLAGLLIVAACGAPPQPTPTTFDLTVAVDGNGTGTVTSDIGDITISSGDDPVTTTFEAGTTVTLTATEADGSTFTGWTGDCTGTDPCEITLDANANVTATFTTPTPGMATLNVTTTGNGDGNVTSDPAGIDLDAGTASAEFPIGTTITLTATADATSDFGGWTGADDCDGTDPCEITLDENATITANFDVATRTLSVTTTGNGDGNVTSDPAGIDLDAGTASAEFPIGTTITLTAEADATSDFGGWTSGGCDGTSTCVITIGEDTAVTADFFDPVGDVTTDTFDIMQGTDDAEQFLTAAGVYEAGGTQTGSTDLDLMWETSFGGAEIAAVGLRYADVNVPSNAVVTNATITFFRQSGTQPGTVTLDFAGQASDDAPTFVDSLTESDITTRATTTAAVPWLWSGPWNTSEETSPDVSSIVREVLQRDGWSSGNAIAFIITSNDSDENNYRNAHSFEGAGSAPVLSITYYVPTAP